MRPLITAPELGEIEKRLFLKMFAALPGSGRQEYLETIVNRLLFC